ncbi:hypothetical protein IR083_03750 [Dysgonomonas sp. GY75]|nr:hypothetical protein [Dysgonomonas sp. GY75]MBF0647930.1 hypothetical protein [Dysgonomonas sp. GY75]
MQQEYGIDGFKFDAGDNSFYNPQCIDSYKKDATSIDHTTAWMKTGLEFHSMSTVPVGKWVDNHCTTAWR